jgi:hypothetical protein
MGTGVVGPNVGSAAVGVPRGTTVAARWGPTVGTRAAVLTTGSGPVATEVGVASNSCSKIATAVGTTTSSAVGDGIGDVVGASITTGAVVTTVIASCCVASKPGPEDTSALSEQPAVTSKTTSTAPATSRCGARRRFIRCSGALSCGCAARGAGSCRMPTWAPRR